MPVVLEREEEATCLNMGGDDKLQAVCNQYPDCESLGASYVPNRLTNSAREVGPARSRLVHPLVAVVLEVEHPAVVRVNPVQFLLVGVDPRGGVAQQPPHGVDVGLADAMFVEGIALQGAAGTGVVDGALVVIDEADEVLSVALHPEQCLSHPVGVLSVVVEREHVVEVVEDLPPTRAAIGWCRSHAHRVRREGGKG